MNTFPVWHLSNADYNPVRLYQSDDAHYIVTEDGNWAPILSCGLFIIINQELLSFFQQNSDVPIHAVPVSIYDRVLEKYFEGYYRIYIKEQITPQNLDDVDSAGKKIWCHEGSGGIFISIDLKDRLEQSDIQGLKTVPGFSMYGGD
jgi:hypothetical protein